MYDLSLDHAHDGLGRRNCQNHTAGRRFAIAAILGLVSSATAAAQLPGAPVLQNAWATPGIVGALNVAGGGGSLYALAGSWTPGSAHFQLSGGFGYQSPTGLGSRAAYGARVAIPFGGAASTFGFGAFAGIGGGTSVKKGSTLPVPSGVVIPDSTTSSLQIPVGAAIGWRHAVGPTHGVSVYATPSYVLFSGGSSTAGVFRTAIGADVGLTSSIGATLGIEFGQTRGQGVGGPSGTLYGLGLSYALGHR